MNFRLAMLIPIGPFIGVTPTGILKEWHVSPPTCRESSTTSLTRLRFQDRPADMDCAVAAAHRQVEWRADLGVGSDRGELCGHRLGIALGPHYDGALLTQIVEILSLIHI